MNTVQLPVQKPVKYIMTGKFQAPSPDWIHMSRQIQEYELFIMTENILYLTVNHTEYTLQRGDFLLCPPLSHQEGFRNSDCSFYWLHFIPDVSEADPGGTTIPIPVTGHVPNPEKIIILMKQLQDTIRTYQINVLTDYLTTTILCELSSQCLSGHGKDSSLILRQQIYNDILDYVKWYLDTNLKVTDIAKHFGYNEKYLSHLFHSIKGISLKQYILEEKISQSKYFLSDTNKTISAIAEDLGFNDSHNFMKQFKKQTGMTPTEYRNAYGKRLLFYK